MTLLVVNAAVTWFMVGLIWTIQMVHYPLFRRVPVSGFVEYEREHTVRMGRLLAVPAVVEIGTAGALVWYRPADVPLLAVLGAGALLAAVWLMTAAVQARQHRALSNTFDAQLVDHLISGNWWRTMAWTARGFLVGWLVLL